VAGWQANSGARDGIEAGAPPLTGSRFAQRCRRSATSPRPGKYVISTQSNADESKLVVPPSGSVPSGAQDVAGVQWVVYGEFGGESGDAVLAEPVWTTRLGGADGTQICPDRGGGRRRSRTPGHRDAECLRRCRHPPVG
jgi:hypothetical protein